MAEAREDVPAPLAGAGKGIGLTDPPASETAAVSQDSDERRSLFDDIEALIDDGRTYLDAELSYQKTRVVFISDRLKKAIGYALVALVIALLAAIGLTVGLIIAPTPLLTGWGATALVVGAMLLLVALLLRRAARNWKGAMGAMHADDDTPAAAGGEG